ncbi:hypothetical protein HYC85_003280 [Camellia sinensis]|uniref:Uncharacterized protein n=1 Tax=Camellia sinensis TaxID=4442 RepID=A0A7J7IBZ6_CAMSI|nr:hypothetical protein HYC85_003280 [Camellia sinensis]
MYKVVVPKLEPHNLKGAGSFNYHGMQYSTTMPNDLDIHKDFIHTNKLESSGLSLKDIVEQRRMSRTTRCSFCARSILEDPELKNVVKAYSIAIHLQSIKSLLLIYKAPSHWHFLVTQVVPEYPSPCGWPYWHHIISNSDEGLSSGNPYWRESSSKISYWGYESSLSRGIETSKYLSSIDMAKS